MSSLPKEYQRLVVIMLISLLIVAVVMATFAWTVLFTKDVIDTETNKVKYDPIGLGYYVVVGGQVDRTGNPEEILDDIAYISSWKPDGRSEKIVLSVYIKDDHPDWYEWHVYLDPNANWENPMYKSTPNENSDVIYWINHGGTNPGRITYDYPNTVREYEENLNQVIELRGNLGNMYMRVEFVFRCSGLTYGRTFILHDEARILDGSGRVVVQPDDDGDKVFEVGDTVTIKVWTGASGQSVGANDKGWVIRLYNPNGVEYKDTTFPKNLNDFLNGYEVRWVIPMDAWRDDWNNKWKITLYNLLIEQSEDYFFTVDVENKQPSMKSLIISPTTNVKIGNRVTVYLEGEPNQYTKSPIDRFMVSVYYGYQGNPTRYIMQDAIYRAENNRATFSFLVDAVGHITVEARCIDEANRISNAIYSGVTSSGESGTTDINVGPGQLLSYKFDTNISYPVLPDYKPEMIIYSFIDTRGKIIYEIKDSSFVKSYMGSSGGNQRWRIKDTVYFVVPAFAKTGEWTLNIKIVDKDAWIISDQKLAERAITFTVVKGSFWQNMLAPLYIHKDFKVFDLNWKLPSPATFMMISLIVGGFVVYYIFRKEQLMKLLQKYK